MCRLPLPGYRLLHGLGWSVIGGMLRLYDNVSHGPIMPDFINELSLRDLAVLCAGLAVAVTWFGILFIKPFLRLLVGGEPNVNEQIGLTTGIFSLFYGLLLSLLTVAAYQNLERVERNVFEEAAALGRLYSDLATYPEPTRSEVRGLMRDYALYTIHKDWPAHRDGRAMIGGDHRANTMRQRIAAFEPQSVGEEILHREVVSGFQRFAAARQDRLSGVLTRIPNVLWLAVGVGALVNILLLVMLKIRPVPHLVLGGIAAFFLGVMLFVIIALDDPFRGANHVEPTVMEAIWERQMVFDEPMG
jgi:hypothetical protein